VKGALAIARKELRDILRERTIAVALLVQFLVAALSTLLAVGLTVLLDPAALPAEARADVAYSGDGGFEPYLRASQGLRVATVSLEEALQGHAAGRFDAVVHETPGTDGSARRVGVLVTEGSLQATVLVPTLRALLEEYQQDLRQDAQGRLQTPVLDVPRAEPGTVSFGFVHGALVPLLLLTPAFLSGAIGGDSWVRESQTGTLLLLRSSPVSVASIVAGKLLVPLLLAPAQALLWLTVLGWGGADVRHVPLLLGATTALAALLAGMGILVASLVRRTAASQTLYALLVLLLAAASLFLPRDPFNVLALLSSGTVLPGTWPLLAGLAVLAAASLAAGAAVAARAVRRAS